MSSPSGSDAGEQPAGPPTELAASPSPSAAALLVLTGSDSDDSDESLFEEELARSGGSPASLRRRTSAKTIADEGAAGSPVVEMMTLVRVPGSRRRGLHSGSTSDDGSETDSVGMEERVLGTPQRGDISIVVNGDGDIDDKLSSPQRGRKSGDLQRAAAASLEGAAEAVAKQRRADFEILKRFDVDRMKGLLETRNWDLLYAFNEVSEQLNDLVQRERSIADLSAEDMAFLEARQPWIDAATLPLEQLLQSVAAGSASSGLSDDEAQRRQAEFGLNRLSSLKRASRLGFFLKHLVQGPSALWWLAATFCFALAVFASDDQRLLQQALVLGVSLVALSFLSGSLAYWFQPRPPLLKRRLLTIYPRHAKVLRDGRYRRVDVEQLVPGDVVELRIGDRVPADMRMLSAAGLYVSGMAGQPDQRRQISTSDTPDDLTNPLLAPSLVFYGTNCLEGSGVGVVLRTGDRTVLGTLAREMHVDKEIPTFLQRDTSPLFVGFFVVTLLLLVVVMAASFSLYGGQIVDPLQFGVVVVLAFLPSGLMLSGYLLNLITGQNMNHLHLNVRQLNSLELLGRISALCCDKTGLLTQPTATVTACLLDGRDVDLSTANSSDLVSDQSFRNVVRAIALLSADCSQQVDDDNDDDNADIDDNDDDDDDDDDNITNSDDEERKEEKRRRHRHLLLRVHERALVDFALRHTNVGAAQRACPQLYSVPFAPAVLSKLTISRCRVANEGARLLVVRTGSLDEVLALCSTTGSDSQERDLLDGDKERARLWAQRAASRGERVVAFCQRYLNPFDFPNDFDFDIDAGNFPTDNYCLLGLLSLCSPVKSSSRELVNRCRNAGIKLVMITDDDALAAAAVARQMNVVLGTSRTVEELAIEENCDVEHINVERAGVCVLLGEQLRHMSDSELDEQILRGTELIFGQTAAEQKKRIVGALQRAGYVVGVTGSEAVESPALNAADVGIARSKFASSPVAVHASDFVLERDDFADLVTGIAESRRFGTNLKKFFAFSLSNKMAQLLPTVLFVFFYLPVPLPGLLILVLDCVCTVVFAITFAFEPIEPGTMLRPPQVRPKNASIINGRLLAFSFLQAGMVQALAAVFVYLAAFGVENISPFRFGDIARVFWDVDVSVVVNGAVFDYAARMALLGQVHSTVFVAMIFMQTVNMFSIRSQTVSLFHPSIIANPPIFASVVINLAICALVCYVPGVSAVFWTQPIAAANWFFSLPFVGLLLLVHELRKLWIRKRPDSTITQHLLF